MSIWPMFIGGTVVAAIGAALMLGLTVGKSFQNVCLKQTLTYYITEWFINLIYLKTFKTNWFRDDIIAIY